MKHSPAKNWLVLAFGLGSPLLLGTISCESNGGGITLPRGGSAGSKASGGNAGTGTGGDAGSDAAGASGEGASGRGGTSAAAGGKGGSGNAATGGSGAVGGSGATGGTGGDGGTSGAADAGASGEGGETANGGEGNATGDGGTGTGGTGGTSGTAGTAGSDPGPQQACIYRSDPAPAEGGEGGAGPAPNGVAVATNAFLGPYLTNLAGLALYIYGADVPGDCNTPPVSNCIDDCTQAWPIFDAGERTLDVTLDPEVFGTILRGDGKYQTTFYGWPLYFYKSDTGPNMINGQGKGKTWFAAEVSLPNLMIMRGPTSAGGIKYLSDDRGRTLYSLPGDTLGTDDAEPVSSCTGSCLDSFSPFSPGDVYPVTSIEPHDVSLVFRDGGAIQSAYKGAPLYYAKGDLRAGEQNGVGVLDAAVVLP